MEKPYSAHKSRIAPCLIRSNNNALAAQTMCHYEAANDNQPDTQSQTDYVHNVLDNAIILAAIRLFAEHGLNSAEHALNNAERCFWADDSLGHKWWMAISHQLDHKLVNLHEEHGGKRTSVTQEFA
ncbi:hypothetical protein ACR9YC_09530 [Parasphingorhabdus sp. DH2-15]|uniref:hypothetical protein n=1 Tax=Parasphingorhabdus sp. DH2-15 TaxID=3444112 RepID=UPI003F6869AA